MDGSCEGSIGFNIRSLLKKDIRIRNLSVAMSCNELLCTCRGIVNAKNAKVKKILLH